MKSGFAAEWRSGGLTYVLALERAHAVEDGRKNVFVSNRGVDHHVIEGPRGPISSEIVFHEQNTFAVYGIDQVFRVAEAPAQTLNSPQFFRTWRIKKHMKR